MSQDTYTIHSEGREYLVTRTRPDFFTVTAPDGYVSTEGCTATSSAFSVVDCLERAGH